MAKNHYKWIFNDGGRSNYFSTIVGDCAVRAIAIALNQDYKKVLNKIECLQQRSINKGTNPFLAYNILLGAGFDYVKIPKPHSNKIGELLKQNIIPRKGTKLLIYKDHLSCLKNQVCLDRGDPDKEDLQLIGYFIRRKIK